MHEIANRSGVGTALYYMGATYEDLGRVDSARAYYRRALNTLLASDDPEPREFGNPAVRFAIEGSSDDVSQQISTRLSDLGWPMQQHVLERSVHLVTS